MATFYCVITLVLMYYIEYIDYPGVRALDLAGLLMSRRDTCSNKTSLGSTSFIGCLQLLRSRSSSKCSPPCNKSSGRGTLTPFSTLFVFTCRSIAPFTTRFN